MKLYNKVILIFFLCGAMCSCLNLSPEDELADGNMWTSASNFKYFANNFYSWTRDFTTSINDAPHSDWRSDMWTSSSINQYSHGSNSIPTSDGSYTSNYAHIRRANLLLQNASSYTGSESISQYVAEAKFFRAYCYFDLLQLYGNVIIVKKPVDINSSEMNAVRNDRKEVANFIIQDLKEAINGLPSTLSSDDNGRLTKWAAYAFLSRVALYEGTWEKFRSGNTDSIANLLNTAVKSSKAVIDSGGYELFKPAALGDSAYKYLFILEDEQSNPVNLTKSANKEYIFSRRHDETLSPIGTNVTKTCLKNVMYINRKFANLYLCSDGLPIDKSSKFSGYGTMTSEFTNRDNRMKNTLLANGLYYWANNSTNCRVDWKGMAGQDALHASACDVRSGSGYQNQKWAAEREVKDTYEGYDYPIIRYAEVLLNYAEALYERDGAISDDDLDKSLNLVRCRVNSSMPKLSNSLVENNGLSMREEIRRERTIELFDEGFRIDDLKRWKTAETEMPEDILGIKWSGTAFESKWGTASSTSKNTDGCLILENGRAWESKNYLYPIPTDQLQLNPNIGQNTGW